MPEASSHLVTDEEVIDAAEMACSFLHLKRQFGQEDFEDVFQEICVALLRARERFDPSKAKWTTYAVSVAKGVVSSYWRSNVVDGASQGRSRPGGKAYRQSFTSYEDLLIDLGSMQQYEQLELRETVRDIDHPRYRFIVLALIAGYSRAEIGEMLGINPRRISHYCARLAYERSKYLALQQAA